MLTFTDIIKIIEAHKTNPERIIRILSKDEFDVFKKELDLIHKENFAKYEYCGTQDDKIDYNIVEFFRENNEVLVKLECMYINHEVHKRLAQNTKVEPVVAQETPAPVSNTSEPVITHKIEIPIYNPAKQYKYIIKYDGKEVSFWTGAERQRISAFVLDQFREKCTNELSKNDLILDVQKKVKDDENNFLTDFDNNDLNQVIHKSINRKLKFQLVVNDEENQNMSANKIYLNAEII